MTELLTSPTDSGDDQAINEALKALEKAVRVYGNTRKSRGKTRKSRRRTALLSTGLRGISAILRDQTQTTSQNSPRAGTANRFPTNNGLNLTDLASLIQKFTLRNL